MKKKLVFLPFVLLLTLVVTACGVKKVPVSSIISGEIRNQAGRSFEVSYSDEETRAMSNYMMEGRFLHNGKTLYGTRHKEKTGNPCLCWMKFTAGEKEMRIREVEEISADIDARYLILEGNYLYYLQEDCLSGERAIVRVISATGTGAYPEILYSGQCDFLTMIDGRLYFTDSENHLVSMACDGSDYQLVLSDKEIYYPYFLSKDILLFQDDADGESLHMRYFPTGFELRIALGRVCCYVVRGSEIWFLRADDPESEKCRLCKVNLNEFLSSFDPYNRPNSAFPFTIEEADVFMGPLFSINGGHINASNNRTEKMSDWRLLEDNAWEVGYLSACQYVAKDFEIYYSYNVDGLITEMFFYEPEILRKSLIEQLVYVS